MFPSARNSVRQTNRDGNNNAIPIPVAVTLHNFIQLPQKENGESHDEDNVTQSAENGSTNDAVDAPHRKQLLPQDSTGSNRFFRPQHSSSLLPRLHLDIAVENSENDCTVYSHTLRSESVHPSWEHLDEQLHVPSSITKCWWKDHAVYKSMRLKLFVLQEEKDDDERIQHSNGNKTSETTKMEMLEAPLHPSLLQRIDNGRIPSSGAASLDGSLDGDDDDNLFGSNSSKLPPLPPNSLLVHYSDGSIRCLPHLYQLLWDYKHFSQAPPIEDFDRFEDDVFKTLDNVQSTPQRRERTASSLLDQDQEEEQYRMIQQSKSEDSREKDVVLEHLQQEQQEEDLAEKIVKEQQLTIPPSFPCNEEDAAAQDLAHQNELLRQQIENEERQLGNETQTLRDEQVELKDLIQQLQELDHEAKLMRTEVHKQVALFQEDQILKRAQGIKLLRDLRAIYPITLETVAATSASSSMALSFIGGNSSNRGTPGGYLIRGLRLPVDIYTTTVPEEEINASMGFCVHLVFMIAKYLTIQLRHRIFCNSSRSAIQQDGVGIFPLFLGRMVARSLEREQVDRGARLLGGNVNCILMHLGMPQSLHTQHILARLNAILHYVAEGNVEHSHSERVHNK